MRRASPLAPDVQWLADVRDDGRPPALVPWIFVNVVGAAIVPRSGLRRPATRVKPRQDAAHVVCCSSVGCCVVAAGGAGFRE